MTTTGSGFKRTTDPDSPANSSGSLYAVFRQGWDLSAPFMLTPDSGQWAYADLDLVTALCSQRLRNAGLVKGDRLVSQLDRSPWNVFLYLACLRAGITYVPLSPKMTAAEAGPILDDVRPAAIICAPQLEEANQRLTEMAPVRLFTMDTEGKGSFSAIPVNPDVGPDAAVGLEDTAAIVFTSGTTGRPKGAMLPHGLLILKARALAQALGYRREDRLLHTMPLYHAHGLFMTTHCVLSAGASMLLLPRFDAQDVVERLPSVTVFSGVATMYKRMLSAPALREKASAMRLFVAASAALPTDLFHAFENASGHQIIECWGMSETMTNTASPLHGTRKPGSAGKPLPGVEVKVLDAAGRECERGKPGALAVRAAARFGGYWRRPPQEQPRFEDGFFVTGDIGYLDEEGYLHIVGRTGDVIISGGYNVYPREVELALEQIDGVQRAAVFGLPHPEYGEAVAAAIELAPGASLSADDVITAAKQRVASYKAPKAVFMLDTLPLTELGKLRRRSLIDAHANHFTSVVGQGPA